MVGTVRGLLAPEYLEFIGLEAEAESVIHWAITGVPGLLQTREYAREVHLSYQNVMPNPPGLIDRRVGVRMLRQEVLTTRQPPLQLSVVLDESVLLRRIGDRELMRAQLLHMAAMSERPNIELRILPLRTGRLSLSPGPFRDLRLSAAEDETAKLADVVSIEA